jgi:hypothetical protein
MKVTATSEITQLDNPHFLNFEGAGDLNFTCDILASGTREHGNLTLLSETANVRNLPPLKEEVHFRSAGEGPNTAKIDFV